MNHPTPRGVLITGASSGLGRALAETSAAPGVTLHLSGRDAGRLAQVAASCVARGADVRSVVLDVTDAPAMADWIAAAGRLDLVIANAGISGGTGMRWSRRTRPPGSSPPMSPAC